MSKRIAAQRVQINNGDSNLYHTGALRTLCLETKYLTWRNFCNSSDVEYSWVKHRGAPIEQYLRSNPDIKMEKIISRFQACVKSCQLVGQDTSRSSIYDVAPRFLADEYLSVLNEISTRVWQESTMSPIEYQTLKNNHIVSLMCSENELEFDVDWIRRNSHNARLRNFMKSKAHKRIKYNIFGTKTGRFSTATNSFPILSLDKAFRNMLLPRNDLFAVFDYNAAEIRTLLSLSGKPQPSADIHEWNRINIFDSKVSREKAKQRFFAWLYNPDAKSALAEVYNRESVLEAHWDGSGFVETAFGRRIPATRRLSLNYLLQSSTNDMIMESLSSALTAIPQLRETLAFVIHDSIVLDCKREHAKLLHDFKHKLEETRFGRYRCSFHVGRNFGDLRAIV